MTTTPLDAMIKIRSQILVAELYRENNPDWQSTVEILAVLRDREKALLAEIKRGGHDGRIL